MKKLKCVLSLALSLCLMVTLGYSFTGAAHDFTPKRYWCVIYRHSGMNKSVAQVTYYDTLSPTLQTPFNNAIHDWDYADQGHVDPVRKSMAEAKYKISQAWSSEYPSSAFAVTVSHIQNASIKKYSNNSYSNYTTINNIHKIIAAETYINLPCCLSYGFTTNDHQHNFAHEFGHVMGFNETNTGEHTVMRQGRGSTFPWSNPWKLTSHDTNDIVNKYNLMMW